MNTTAALLVQLLVNYRARQAAMAAAQEQPAQAG